jgi:hypothetical protein
VFVPEKPFQASQSFVSMAAPFRQYPLGHSPGACIIKLNTAVVYGFRNKLECFVPGKPFQPSLVFRDKHLFITKTVNYGRNKSYDTGPRPYSQNLD